MKSVFEQYPVPWAVCKSTPDGDYSGVISTATGDRVHYFEWAIGLLGEEIYSRVVECVNALAGRENPAQWVGDMKQTQKEYIERVYNSSLRRIELLEAQIKNGQTKESAHVARIAELEAQVARHPERIQIAIEYFTKKVVPLAEVQDWSNGIDPTQPIDQ